MNIKDKFRSSLLLKSIFAVSLFLLFFISGISYKHTLSLTESTKLLVQSYRIQTQIEQVLSYLKDAETGQRGFIISHDSVFLKPYHDAPQKIDRALRALKSLSAGNSEQLYNIEMLEHLIHLRLSLLVRTLVWNAQGPKKEKLVDANLLKGNHIMDLIRVHINKMLDFEQVYLKEHQKKYEHEIYFTPFITLLLLLFTIILLILSYVKINRDLLILRKTNADLLLTTEAFKHAEEIGDFSSWQWNLDTNKLHYSDNQYHLMGSAPQSFEPTIGNFLNFIHPDDRHIIEEGAVNAMQEKNGSTAFFRIYRKDGALRYFKSVSKLTDFHGEKLLIGINSDITEQQLSKIVLEERNRALEQSNNELASFNHIASHDLQEPLRKIETFLSRFSEQELMALSETGRVYISRIQASTHRMRILIDDLLLFSRTNKTEKVFSKTDLNLIIDNIKLELAQDIEEKKAVLIAAPLPVLNVIPFQIQQLFLNLIGNALKYSKADVYPLIRISCKKIIAHAEPLLKMEGDEKFYKISIADNGLGFEQHYAEKIFILFYRLHHKTEFPGSGIGLSICKKIVENHGGFIMAKSEPGMGAMFTVYLPIN